MRYYGFGNYYLSSLQQGLQAHHVCVEMFNRFNDKGECDPGDIGQQWYHLDEWAKNHKTIVLLNGGNSADLKELHDFMVAGHTNVFNNFPYACFHEDEQSLCGALTSVGIVLPPHIYDTAAIDRSMRGTLWVDREGRHGWADVDGKKVQRPTGLNAWEEELIVRLNKYGLAK